MTIASTSKNFSLQQEVEYRMMTHPRSEYSMETAEKAYVHGDALAKGVLVFFHIS